MSILFGHPTGTPFAHQAGLAHFERGRLESFCVPWMPEARTLRALSASPVLRAQAARLTRRHFPALANAPKSQGRAREIMRLLRRGLFGEDARFVRDANIWLMQTMTRECRRANVTAVHAYEDCSLTQFEEAKRLGKACIYDLPIGYHEAWEAMRGSLERKYADWLSSDRDPQFASPGHKRREAELADLILVPSRFVAETLKPYYRNKPIAVTPYGADFPDLPLGADRVENEILTFLYVGQCSMRKGIPLLLTAWRVSGIKNARLLLVGPWKLAEEKKRSLPSGCDWTGPISAGEVQEFYRDADVFVFPTNFEGRALVVLEALAAGLPVLTTEASGVDCIDTSCSKMITPDNLEELVESLRWFASKRDCLPRMRRSARLQIETFTWSSYRETVSQAVAPFV